MNKTEADIKDKRKYPRLKNLYLISYIHKEAGRQISPVAMGRTLDISPSGVRVEVFQEINVDSEMEIEIALEDTQISVSGIVVRALNTGNKVFVLGIQFNEVCKQLINTLSF